MTMKNDKNEDDYSINIFFFDDIVDNLTKNYCFIKHIEKIR